MRNQGEESSNPAKIFNQLRRDLEGLVARDPQAKEIHDRLLNFGSAFISPEDAEQLHSLMENGAGKLNIKVGNLPSHVAPGVAYLYDITLEAIRLNPARFTSLKFSKRAFETLESVFDIFSKHIGNCSVKALRGAMQDDEYADRLRQHGKGLGFMAFVDDDGYNPNCDHCWISDIDRYGNVIPGTTRCGTKTECGNFLIGIILFLVALLIAALVDWWWD